MKTFQVTTCLGQCWASYSNNVIYYSLLVTLLKVILLLINSGNSN